MVYNWLNNIQNGLLSNTCILCGQQGQKYISLCRDCHKDLIFLKNTCIQCAIPLPETAIDSRCGACLQHPPAFDTAFSLFAYQAPVSRLIQGLKFHDRLAHARLLGTLLAQQLAERLQTGPDCILPVPLSVQRVRERGFNQSVELARPVSRLLDIPIATGLLRRVRHTQAQTELSFQDRRSNIRNAFEHGKQQVPAHVAIIDDVITSGSTCNEMARILKKGGAERVDIWSIARAFRQ